MNIVQGRTPRAVGATLRILLLVVLVCGSSLSGRTVLAAAPTATIVVSPTNLNGWGFFQETATGSGGFVAGPATAPLGIGSAQLVVDGLGGVFLGTAEFRNTRLDALTGLSYSTYRTAGGAAQAIALQLGMDYNLTDADTSFQGRLVYEPSTAGPVADATWQTWNPLTTGTWFATRAPYNEVCPLGGTCTFAQVLAEWPNAGINASELLGGVFLKAGGNWAGGFTGSVDALTIATAASSTTFDFNPEPLCTTLCYVNGASGNDANGGASAADAKKTIQAAVTQVAVGGTVEVAVGTYNENITIAKNGVTLRGAGAGSDPAIHTIVNNAAPAVAGSHGIRLNNGITGVTITQLRVQGFASSGIFGTGGNNNFTVDGVHLFNNAAGGSGGGLYLNGPVSTVVITGSDVQNNTTRGIVIWNGFKQNITISNNIVRGNNCCGIELQDGTASGVTITGNTIANNGDNAIGVTGLMAGAGPNLIANNTLSDNGRFGIEVKLPNGTGLETGDGSIVVRNNTIARTAVPSDLRDLAGIAVMRRGWVTGNNNVDVPTGVIVRNNTVSGYQQPSTSEGFGIVVEGSNMTVVNNTVSGSDVGIQRQAGNLPYTANTNIDGDQTNKVDEYFGRGNSPSVCAVVRNNTLSLNGVNTRDIGPVNQPAPGLNTVTNTTTAAAFCSIQSAIDAAATLDGHTLNLSAGTFRENVVVSKSLTLVGASRDTTILQPVLPGECPPFDCTDPIIVMTAAPIVALRNLTLDGDNPTISGTVNYNGANPDAGFGVAGNVPNLSLRSLTVDNLRVKNTKFVGIGPTYLQPYTITNSIFENIAEVAIVGEGDGLINTNTFTGNKQAIIIFGGNTLVSNNTVISSSIGIQASAGLDHAVTLTNNTISACTGGTIGISAWQVSTEPMQINANRISGCAEAIVLYGTEQMTRPTLVTNNEIDGAGLASSQGIVVKARTEGSVSAAPNSAIVRNNTLTNVNRAVVVERSSGVTNTVVISANAFLNTTVDGVVLTGSGPSAVSAQLNWWNSASGPTTAANPGGSGVTVSAGVVFSPWLCSGTDTSLAIGFQPDLTACSAPGSLATTAGTPQSATINTAFGTNLQVTVRDLNNNPIAGVLVTFTAPVSGASGTFPGGATTVTATTDAAGVATAAVFTANGTLGSYTVVASVENVATTASFALTNTAAVYTQFLPLVMRSN